MVNDDPATLPQLFTPTTLITPDKNVGAKLIVMDDVPLPLVIVIPAGNVQL